MSENFFIYFDKFMFIKNEKGIYIENLKYESFTDYFRNMFYEFDEGGLGYDFDFLTTRRCNKKIETVQKFVDLSEELKQKDLDYRTIEGSIDDCEDFFNGTFD